MLLGCVTEWWSHCSVGVRQYCRQGVGRLQEEAAQVEDRLREVEAAWREEKRQRLVAHEAAGNWP